MTDRGRSLADRTTAVPRAVVFFILAIWGAACGSSSTSSSPVGPDVKCDVSATATPVNFGAPGGSGTVAVTTARDCTWTAATDAPWITIATRAGQGAATVRYSVAVNGAPAARAATITVVSERLAIAQAAAQPPSPDPSPPTPPNPPAPPPSSTCAYALDRESQNFGPGASDTTVGVRAAAGCTWSTASNASWLSITGAGNGAGNGQVRFSVAANSSSAARTGTLTIAGLTFVVTQDARPAPIPPPKGPADVSGTLSGLTGSCPAVSFHVGGRLVVTDEHTKYQGKQGSCGALREGSTVEVKAHWLDEVTVFAEKIEIK